MEVVKAVGKQGNAAANSIAIRADQMSYTYVQLISSAWNISNLLCNAGLKTVDDVRGNGHLGGARIGIVAKPSAEFVAGVLATWFSGGVAVPLALSYPETELLHVMHDSDISMVLSTEDYKELMQNIAAKSAAKFSLIPSVPSISSQRSEQYPSQMGAMEAHRGEDPALIVYTSGTTGKPKGVVHTHKSITAQVQILAEAWEYTSADQFLHCLPLHHVHGLFNALFAPIYAGSMVEFMPKFSVRGIWQRLRESYPINGKKADDAITVFTGVPTMYTRLIQGYEAMDSELQAASAFAARQLRLMMCGSSALPLPVMEQWENITGHRLLERYGMTEFVMAISNPLRGVRKAGTVGKPFPGVQVKIVEDETENDPTGVGELCVKSPSLFKEYWKLPKVTSESFTDDGFFKTGDAGKIDEDGYYVILGRTSADIMKVGGYKLSALEIESALLEYPGIAECCVLGLPDKDYGDAVCAIIVQDEAEKRKIEEQLKPALSLEELREWAKGKLAPYKLPTRLFLWDSLPRNAMGKVNKKALKTVLAAEQQNLEFGQ
ncbi:probable CoA ligase CCL8 isoform X2 [Manihot esculenta]|nr:probable CoA ligase CCL8 isoform X2 [Manihot esculenta]XP_043818053.1 probable CoA ligase CCL8 isoform X2 [Manihot esculenta]KAG8643411.1 hypothetical protein MANES_11G037400v8 [Manihot esculenta]KAG8643412.1 hypothetical protein MANES_11G037400v8 [Manihot esculenta]